MICEIGVATTTDGRAVAHSGEAARLDVDDALPARIRADAPFEVEAGDLEPVELRA